MLLENTKLDVQQPEVVQMRGNRSSFALTFSWAFDTNRLLFNKSSNGILSLLCYLCLEESLVFF